MAGPLAAPAAGKKGGGKQKPSPAAPESTLEELRAVRVGKAEGLRAAGGEPYQYRFERTATAAELQAAHAGLEPGASAEGCEPVAVAGRVMARRVFGKLAFVTVRDSSGDVQLQFEKRLLPAPPAGEEAGAGGGAGDATGGGPGGASDASPTEEANRGALGGCFADLKAYVDVGDFLGAVGGMRKTDKGEVTVQVAAFGLLTKSLRPLPDKRGGLADVEKRYRQRYVDMIVTPGVRDVFRKRSKVLQALREELEARDYVEAETPVLEASAGGAEARPFLTHHNALGRGLSLRIATELHLKRMVVGGFERVYELGRVFRNEGISTRHNPEFTSLETYQAFADYTDMLELTEHLVRACALKVLPAACDLGAVPYQGARLDLQRPFRRATMRDLVREATGEDFGPGGGPPGETLEEARARAVARLRGMGDEVAGQAWRAEQAPSKGHLLVEVFEAAVERGLEQPTFVLEHPVETSPLSKPHRSVPGVTERFELFIAGRELANAFSELTDPVEQRGRLEAQVAEHSRRAGQSGAEEAEYDVTVDEDFLAALEYGMPPTAGMGLGVDRLVMLLTDSASIRDVIPFPLLKS